MDRILVLIAAFVAVSCSTRSASAQFGGLNFGNHTPVDDTIQQQRQDILSQQQKYAHPAPRAAVPSPRFHPGGRSDATGRMDLSGRPAPGYPTIRDESFNFGASRYSYSRGRRISATRPRAPSSYFTAGTRRQVR